MRLPSLLGIGIFVVHATAIVVVAVPSPERLKAMTGERESSDDRLAKVVRPYLDKVIPSLERASRASWRLTRPLRPVLGEYAATFRVSQSWRMFAQPPRVNSYLAVCADYEAAPGRACHVVGPRMAPSEFKGVLAYWPSFRDKAMSNAYEAVLEARGRHATASERVRTRFGVDPLGAIGRYLPPDGGSARATTLEVWHGTVPITPRGLISTGRLSLPSWPRLELPASRQTGSVVQKYGARWVLLRAGEP